LSIFNSIPLSAGTRMTSVLCLLFCIFCVTAAAQEVTVLTTDGSQITGSILEYKDGILKIKTQGRTLKIPAAELAQVKFTPDGTKASGKAELHLLHGKQFLELGMEDEAMKEFRAAMHESPMYARPHYEIGALLSKRGQKKEVLQYFSRAIKLDPNLPDITAKDFLDVANVYLDDDRLEDAADTYHLIYRTFPGDPVAEEAVYQAGFLFAGELKNDEKALEALQDAVEAFPESQDAEQALYEIGRLREKTGSPEAAEGVLIQFISAFPESHLNDDAHYIMAKIYLQMRRNEDAIQELKRVIDESTDSILVASARDMLDECVWYVYDISHGLLSDDVKALAQDGDYLWVGTTAGITRFHLKDRTFKGGEFLNGMDIRALAVDDAHLWVGTLNSGVKRYNKLANSWAMNVENEGLSSDSVLAISIDADTVWLGTALNGVYRYNKFDGNWSNYTMSHGLPSDSITSIESAPNGGAWCGTWKKGASFFDDMAGTWQNISEISEDTSVTVTSISAGLNYVWVAWNGQSSNGVSLYDLSTKKWKIEQDTQIGGGAAISIINLAANDREAWIGADGVALLYDYATQQWYGPFGYPPKFSDIETACVLIGDDSVWFATPRGLGRLDRKLLRRINYIRTKMDEANENF